MFKEKAEIDAILKRFMLAKRIYANLFTYYKMQRKLTFTDNVEFEAECLKSLDAINDSLLLILEDKINIPEEMIINLNTLVIDAASDYGLSLEFGVTNPNVNEKVEMVINKINLKIMLIKDMVKEIDIDKENSIAELFNGALNEGR